MMTYYKVLAEGGSAYHGGYGKWHLPKGKRPGKWMPPLDGDLVPCRNGYHLCRRDDLVVWLGPVIWEVEARGEVLEAEDKVVARQARLLRRLDNWTDRTARLFACDCAERALKKYTKNPDTRSVEVIKVARAFADGKASLFELAAARAAGDAARDAARAAAWDAAWEAARAAALDAGRAAARAAERKWQTKRLFEYLGGKRG